MGRSRYHIRMGKEWFLRQDASEELENLENLIHPAKIVERRAERNIGVHIFPFRARGGDLEAWHQITQLCTLEPSGTLCPLLSNCHSLRR
jgi:hypothetical protein